MGSSESRRRDPAVAVLQRPELAVQDLLAVSTEGIVGALEGPPSPMPMIVLANRKAVSEGFSIRSVSGPFFRGFGMPRVSNNR